MRVTLAVTVIALFDVSILMKGELPVNCPYCNRPMIPGFIQARSEVYFTQFLMRITKYDEREGAK